MVLFIDFLAKHRGFNWDFPHITLYILAQLHR
jgi:hypothetical protein